MSNIGMIQHFPHPYVNILSPFLQAYKRKCGVQWKELWLTERQISFEPHSATRGILGINQWLLRQGEYHGKEQKILHFLYILHVSIEFYEYDHVLTFQR